MRYSERMNGLPPPYVQYWWDGLFELIYICYNELMSCSISTLNLYRFWTLVSERSGDFSLHSALSPWAKFFADHQDVEIVFFPNVAL